MIVDDALQATGRPPTSVATSISKGGKARQELAVKHDVAFLAAVARP
jgi:hypothetical protein